MVEHGGVHASRWLRAHGIGRALAGALVAGWLAACAPALQQGGGSARTHRDLEMLTRNDMASGHFHNAYEAVQALRGNWLITRQQGVPAADPGVQVYMDNIRLGNISELRGIQIEPVVYIRHYDALQATERWGLGHTQGVIYISTHPF